jgi:hypothetical protein
MVHAGKLRLVKFGPKKSLIFAADIATMLNELRGAAASAATSPTALPTAGGPAPPHIWVARVSS